jgi:hypothetical protein
MAGASEWSLTSPLGGDTVIHFRVPNEYRRRDLSAEAFDKHKKNQMYISWWETTVFPEFVRNTLWWPNEHYAAALRIVQLADPELVFLRRHDHAIVGTSFVLGTSLHRTTGGNIDSVSLVITPHPDSVNVAAVATGVAGSAARLSAPIPPTTAMLGIEIPSRDGLPAGRTRFGITPPAALRDMKADEQAISQPVLLNIASNAALPSDADAALKVMAPTAEATRGGAIGIYWETYGFKASDSVTIAVRLQRGTNQSALRQLAIALNLVPDQNTPVAISWRESSAYTGSRMVIDGPVPIIGRSLRVSTTELPPGEYTLQIGVQRAGGEPVRSQKVIRIR